MGKIMNRRYCPINWKSFIRIAFMLMVLGCNGCIADAMFTRMVRLPDEPCQEFSGVDDNDDTVVRGYYLGLKKNDGKNFHHYQFNGILKGDRVVDIYISSRGYGEASAIESSEDIASSNNIASVKPAYLILNVNSRQPEEWQYLLKRIPAMKSSGYEPILCGGMFFEYRKIFIYLPRDASSEGCGNKSWEGEISVNRVRRSETMFWIRQLYGIPAAIACVPADVIMCVYTPFEMILLPRRIEAMAYLNLSDMIGDGEEWSEIWSYFYNYY